MVRMTIYIRHANNIALHGVWLWSINSMGFDSSFVSHSGDRRWFFVIMNDYLVHEYQYEHRILYDIAI